MLYIYNRQKNINKLLNINEIVFNNDRYQFY